MADRPGATIEDETGEMKVKNETVVCVSGSSNCGINVAERAKWFCRILDLHLRSFT